MKKQKVVIKRENNIENAPLLTKEKNYIPRINGLKDFNSTLLNYGSINITYLSLLSLEVIFSTNEYHKIKNMDARFKPGWLQDEVIAAYFHHLRNQFPNMEFIQPSEALAARNFKSTRSLLSSIRPKDISHVFLPYNDAGVHWILAVIDVNASDIIILDPISNIYQCSNESHNNAATIASKILNVRFSKEVSKIHTIKHSLQQDSNSCGVYCCFYASKILYGMTSF